MKLNSEKNIPIGYCPKCNEDVPLNIQPFKKGKREIILVGCIFCDTALNVDDDCKVNRYVSVKELHKIMEAKGYERDAGRAALEAENGK